MTSEIAIGIDARKARDFGIGTYTRELIAALGALTEASRARFLLYVRPGDRELFSSLPPNFGLVAENAPGYSLRELFGFGSRVRRARLDLFHALHYVLPAAGGVPCVVTVHDAIHLEFPDGGASPLRYPYARIMIRRALARSGAVITPSLSVRRELEEISPANAAKMEAIPHGASAKYRPDVPESEVERVRARYALPDAYALYLGGAKPHKNLTRVVDAFRAARTGGLSLVLAGPLPPASAGEIAAEGVHRTGLVAEEDLPALYRGASFLLYPTLAEGFCFPLLEAMASGVPAIASDIPACREVAAGAARLVDPRDTAAITRAVEALSGDSALRADLSARGLARARDFSWKRTAERTWSVYRRVLDDR